MPDGSQAGKLLMVGFEGTTVPKGLRVLVRDHGVAGVILFSRNVEALEQLVEMVRELRALREEPLLIAVDHEGGRVTRVGEPFTPLPPFRALGRADDDELARAWGRLVAAELLAAGIDMDLAPVMDVDSNPANPIIGDRALSGDPACVARLGSRVIRAMRENGLLSCAKHFPGHGDTTEDSHLALPVVERPRPELEAVEAPPFRAAVEAGVDAVMSAHVVYTALDAGAPATLSPGILTGILRGEWGYDGVVISDDLEMAAIADRYGAGESAVLAVLAGCDLLLACRELDRQFEMIEHLRASAENGHLPPDRLAAAVRRVETLQLAAAARAPDPDEARAVLGCAAHRAVAGRMARALED